MLNLDYAVKLFFVYGFFSGILSAIFYILRYGVSEGLGAVFAVMIFAPIGQSIVFAILGIVGYPFYMFLAKRNYLKLGKIDLGNR